jgi:hypothetical protein
MRGSGKTRMIRICLGIGEYVVNASMGSRNLTQLDCLKPWFQNIHYTFESLVLDGGQMI